MSERLNNAPWGSHTNFRCDSLGLAIRAQQLPWVRSWVVHLLPFRFNFVPLHIVLCAFAVQV